MHGQSLNLVGWYSSLFSWSEFILFKKTVREGAVDVQRGGEAAIELYKDPEYGNSLHIVGALWLVNLVCYILARTALLIRFWVRF